jgi:hypothetical protein
MTLNTLALEIKQATDYQRNRTLLREQIKADLVVSHNDGLFVVTPELIGFLNAWDDDELFVEDQYGNPIKCNRMALLKQCKQQHQRVLNRWHGLHDELQRVRKI